MNTLIYKQESYDIIGSCMEVHKELGKGFSEIVYGDSLEIESLTKSHIKQTLNYLAASKIKLGLLVNFGEDSLNYKRVVL